MSDVAVDCLFRQSSCVHEICSHKKYCNVCISTKFEYEEAGGTALRQERKQPECRVVYEQTLNLKLKGSKECLDSFPQ